MKRLRKKPRLRSLPAGPELPEFGQSAADVAGEAEGDRQLAERCLAGEVAAWEELYGSFHAPLCAAIRGMLGPGGCDLSRVDEIAARVWYALVRNDGELLNRFDPARDSRLGTFLRGLARMEILKYFRTECRRRTREAAIPGRDDGTSAASDWQVAAMIDDFATTLSSTEQEFLEEHLLGQADLLGQAEGDGHDLTESSIWQRCHRIREKLKAFFGRG
jgi:DNA-directed RNA polymerase specialized sigma24 family protein